jgi:signal transduction histidine kinase
LEAAGRAPAENVPSHLGEALNLVNELIARVRDLSLELRPAMLDDLGLLPALVWLFERYTHQTQIHVDFGHNGLEKRFAPEIETAAYRIIQEALTNVARHARESEAAVRVWTNDNVLHLQVEDWGEGFDVDAALAANRSSGLSGMRERTASLGGCLKIESVQGVGTRVHGELPLSSRHLERRFGERNDSFSG